VGTRRAIESGSSALSDCLILSLPFTVSPCAPPGRTNLLPLLLRSIQLSFRRVSVLGYTCKTAFSFPCLLGIAFLSCGSRRLRRHTSKYSCILHVCKVTECLYSGILHLVGTFLIVLLSLPWYIFICFALICRRLPRHERESKYPSMLYMCKVAELLCSGILHPSTPPLRLLRPLLPVSVRTSTPLSDGCFKLW